MILEPDAPTGFREMFAADASKLGVVPDEIRELSALVHQVAAPQSLHLCFESRHAEQLAQDDSGIVEAQGLIEVRSDEKVLCFRALLDNHDLHDISALPKGQRWRNVRLRHKFATF